MIEFGMIPCFAKVDERLWRGARPTAPEAADLAAAGVRAAINLEWEASDDGLWPAGVRLARVADFEGLPLLDPDLADEHVVRALAEVRKGPAIAFLHCRSGQNRTGVVVAAYRIMEKNEPVDAVVADFKSFGGLWADADESYIRGLPARRDALLARIMTI